jgi:hypothetical protein
MRFDAGLKSVHYESGGMNTFFGILIDLSNNVTVLRPPLIRT